MIRRALALFETNLPAVMLARLEAAGEAPAWLIEVGAGRILAATRRGAVWLGLDAGNTPAPLMDAAMPALARLRTLAAQTKRSYRDGPAETLVFWTRAARVRVRCRVEIFAAGGLAVAVVMAEDAPLRAAGRLSGDDDAKLKEIARRIRGGVAADPGFPDRPPPQDAAPGPARPAPEAPVPPTLRASLAHELKTPVSALAAAAEIMRDQRFGPLGSARYVGYAADIHDSAQHVLGVIERMLAEAAPEAPETTGALDFTEVDAGALLESSVSQMAPLAERAGLTLALELPARLPHVVADATSLRQILFNLMTNAMRSTPAGGRVTVSARYSGDGPLTVAIADTGGGMSRGEVDRLLGRTKQNLRPPRATAKRAPLAPVAPELGVGLGLGLPLVQALAAANGAKLSIESLPGHGTSAAVIFRKDRVIPI